MRRAPRPAITAQMYRHFATMTVALTALIAFFANGEKQTAVAAPPVASRPATPAKPAPPPQSDVSDDAGSWGSDEGGDFGHPTSGTYSGAGSWFSNPFGANGNNPALAGPPAVPGLDNPDDPDAPANAPSPPSTAEIAAATAASKLRSGAAGND
jgi:hypothetical protein